MPRIEKPIPKTVLSRRNFLRLGIGAGAGALLKPLETLATPDNNEIEVQQQVDALVTEFLDPEGNIEESQFITKLFQAYEIRTSPSPLEPNKFRYRASDGLPEVGISTQTAYIKGAQMYGETATVVPLSELSTTNPEGKLVLLKTTESIYGTNQYSEAYFVNQDKSGRQQWLNLQARVNNQDLLIDPVALQERADVTEAAVIDPARFKAYDDQVTTYLKGHDDGVQRSLPKLSPRVERERKKSHTHT